MTPEDQRAFQMLVEGNPTDLSGSISTPWQRKHDLEESNMQMEGYDPSATLRSGVPVDPYLRAHNPIATPDPRTELPEQTPGARTAPQDDVMTQFARASAASRAPQGGGGGGYSGGGGGHAGSVPRAKEPFDTGGLALAGIADLLLNKGRSIPQFVALGAQNHDLDWETQQRQMEADKNAAAIAQVGEGNRRFELTNRQDESERTYQHQLDDRRTMLAENIANAKGPAELAKAQAAKDEWDRQQASLQQGRKDLEDYRHPGRGKGGGGGGGMSESDADQAIAQASSTGNTEELTKAMPGMSKKSRDKALKLVTDLDKENRGEDRTKATHEFTAGEAWNKRNLERIAQEQALNETLKQLDAVPKDWRAPNQGNAIQRGAVGIKSWVGGGSGMSETDTNLDNSLRMAGNMKFRDSTGQVANTAPEQTTANSLFRSEGSAASARKLVEAAKKRLEEVRASDPDPRSNRAPDGAPKINGAAQRGEAAGKIDAKAYGGRSF
jgi:hypothetical protein